MQFKDLREIIDDDDFLLAQSAFWADFEDEMAELEEEVYSENY